MLEKIKNFFQSTAGKILSGWDSIKNLWSGQSDKKILTRKDVVMKLINGEANFSCAIEEDKSERLVIHIRTKDIGESMDCRNIGFTGPKITYENCIASQRNFSTFLVTSVQEKKASSNELDGMKRILGLNGRNIVTLTKKPEFASSTSKVPASDSKVLSSEEPSKFINNPSKEQLMKSKLIMPPL
ncbi:hypothetical protein [Wolbachia endosymbiont of Nilaparvata lugens]|nr:hypothetical protein [Wolbachia endosymbiont of Nilaparvata lugens]